MRNDDVVTMMNAGLMTATSHTLPLGSAYIVTKFKGEMNRLFKAFNEKASQLAAEAGIEDSVAFDKRREELNAKEHRSSAETKELAKMNEQLDRLIGLRTKHLEDEAEIHIKPMPYKDWREFKEENKAIKVDGYELFELVEYKLEDILWKAPEDE